MNVFITEAKKKSYMEKTQQTRRTNKVTKKKQIIC